MSTGEQRNLAADLRQSLIEACGGPGMSTREQAIKDIVAAIAGMWPPDTIRACAEAAYDTAELGIRTDQRERDAQFAEQHKATWLDPCDADGQQHSLHTHHRRPFADLLRETPITPQEDT